MNIVLECEICGDKEGADDLEEHEGVLMCVFCHNEMMFSKRS